jgi:AraC-like DNA-binding protein
MDPLSEILSLLKPTTYIAGGFDIGGPIAIQFPKHEGIKCYALIKGEAEILLEGDTKSVQLNAGDCFILPTGRSFMMRNDADSVPIDAYELISTRKRAGEILTWNGGGDSIMVGGYFHFSGRHSEILLQQLPPIVHLKSESDKEALRWSLGLMRQELSEPKPGSTLIAQHLAHLILVQALRLYLTENQNQKAGWLFALAHPQIGPAIQAVHNNPAHPWTIKELATYATMSRSTFAAQFKAAVGKSPMDYVTQWRMLLATDQLTQSKNSIADIAAQVGYESESAFSTAFKRLMGCSPRQYNKPQQN